MRNNMQHKISFKSLLFIFLSSLFWAGNVFATLPENKQEMFDVEKANKEFDETSIELSTQELNLDSLNSGVVKLKSLKDQADICVDTAQDNINTDIHGNKFTSIYE